MQLFNIAMIDERTRKELHISTILLVRLLEIVGLENIAPFIVRTVFRLYNDDQRCHSILMPYQKYSILFEIMHFVAEEGSGHCPLNSQLTSSIIELLL